MCVSYSALKIFGRNAETMATKYLVWATIIVGVTWAQTDDTNIPDLGNVTLPPELAGKVNVEELQNKTLSEFKLKCEKNGGPDAFTKAQAAQQQLGKCVTGLVDPQKLSKEIEEAKPNGNVDEVFKKYCAKKPLFETCIQNFTETTKVCFSVEEQKNLKVVYNVSQQLAEFICFKEGDRIALFIAEGGQECFQDKQDGLKECFNQTGLVQEANVPQSFDTSALSNFTLSFDEKQCRQLQDLQTCVVNVLEGCPKPTSANIVESLFKFIRKSTPCKKFPESTAPSAASNLLVATATVLMAAVASLLI